MMAAAAAGPPSAHGLLPLLESLEDGAAGQSEQTDAYLTIASRLSGDEGRQFLPAVEKHFSRLGTAMLAHVTSPNAELSQAALQALGFCVYHAQVVSGVPETLMVEILSALCSLVANSTDKNTCTRALWVISKQSFPPGAVAKKVPCILGTLESVWSREDVQSVVMEHEALNVVIRLLEQVPVQMGDGALRWAKLVVPLVVHSASKVRLRAAAAVEMGMPLLLERQAEVAAIIEPMMSTKLIPELQKLFMSKNETNVLKLWPMFVKLLGKLLHRGGPFINSLLRLEELGFRSSSPTVKKIAFIAWKSLIDNFALNPDILCSVKRMKLLMQPLMSIHVRTEALLLTKVEVWWYLVVQLGPNLSANFDQVSTPLLQCTIGSDSSPVPGTPSRPVAQNGTAAPVTPKTGTPGLNSSAGTPLSGLNASAHAPCTFTSIQLLGLEMLLHYFLGPEAAAAAAKRKLILSLEPLTHPLLSGSSSFTKHAAVLVSNLRDGFIGVGKEAPESLLSVLWTSLVHFVNLTIESGSKKERQGCEVLTLTLQALQSIVASEALPADRVLVLFEATVKGVPRRVLSSTSYQVGKMDVLNGTPALFLILLLYNSSLLAAFVEDQRFFQVLQALVDCGLSGPTSPLAFAEAVLGAIRGSAGSLQNKEQLWRMWTAVVGPLTDTVTQSNEVNQGDALEHNFSAMHSALLLPVTHLLSGAPLPQAAQKSTLSAWSKLYKVFARCSALVVTAEENICCEELCAKMAASVDEDALRVPSTLNAVAGILQVLVDCVDFSPYTPQFQQKLKSPHTPVNWTRKRNKALGNLSTFQSLLVRCLEVYLETSGAPSEPAGPALVSVLSTLFANLVLANAVQEALASLVPLLTRLYGRASNEPPLLAKLEKLLGEVLGCLQNRSTLAYDSELLALLSPLLCALFPHKNKQIRSSVAQFWNATFANAVSLEYPDEIRPVLIQVKQKTPVILPGFEAVPLSDELSGQYSSESSQLETRLSGMPVTLAGKRDSLPGKPDSGAAKTPKPVSTKLDFGSPKPPRREALEEEASIDFVFIPPETKERVLTEHQKEVKRTKRIDIPAMYNNLDASLDTAVFTQFTQSQEDSLDKIPTELAEKVSPEEVPREHIENEQDPEVPTEETQDYASPRGGGGDDGEVEIPESADVSVEDETKSDDGAGDVRSKEGSSPNVPSSSDLVSGTPQKPNSRRQPFITLEMYPEGKPASPSGGSKFTGPLIKTSNSQERSKTSKGSSSRAGSKSQDSQARNSQRPVNDAAESPRRPKDSGVTCEPVRLTERLPSDPTDDEDVIPDTQAGVEGKEGASSQEEELDDSQSSLTQNSPTGPRRSSRSRVKPDPEGREEKHRKPTKRRRSGEEVSLVQSRLTRRRKQVAEEDGGSRERAQGGEGETGQPDSQGRGRKKVKLYSSSEDLLDKPEPRRRSTRESSQTELLSDSQSDYESQSQGRRRRRSKTSLETAVKNEVDQQSSQKATQELQKDSRTVTPSPPAAGQSQEPEPVEPEPVEPEPVEPNKKDGDELKEDAQVTSSQIDGQSQESELEEQNEKDKLTKDSEMVAPSLESELEEKAEKDGDEIKKDSEAIASSESDGTSQKSEPEEKTKEEKRDSSSSPTESEDRTSRTDRSMNESSSVKRKEKSRRPTDENLSQEDSQELTPTTSDSQTLRRSRRSKGLSDSEDKGDSRGSPRRRSRSNSQTEARGRTGGRTRRSKVQEELSQSSPSSTPESSQPLDVGGSAESSQGRGKYSRRRSSPASMAVVESSESESQELRVHTPVPQKRGRKPRVLLPSPLTVEAAGASQDADTSNAKEPTDLEHSQKSQDPETLQVPGDAEEQSDKESPMEVEVDAAVTSEPVASEKPDDATVSEKETNVDDAPSQEDDTQDVETLESISDEQIHDDPSALDSMEPSDETTDKPQVSEPLEEKAEVSETVDGLEENQKDDSDQEVVRVEDAAQDDCASSSENQVECPDVKDELSTEDKQSATQRTEEEVAEENDDDSKAQIAEDEEQPEPSNAEDDVAVNLDAALTALCDASPPADAASEDACRGSPVKQKDLEAIVGSEVGQSPSGGRTRGTWSPLASPSTSILKKGQKRPLEDDTPSPLVKSRRVTFANPIQRQETADDIDRRSPALRTSSPRRSKATSIPQPKYITTPTKGLPVLSPRNLRSPGYKSSKKCLISEMSQEPRPVPRDCIYPALVGCSTPVEAVLPQISSNMWSRGFGQLVRARNIKTVGDLSALTPGEIKTLPIRSPKISNVKKALRIYEQQRKGRGGGGYELKSFDEMEDMIADVEESSAPQNQEEEEEEEEEQQQQQEQQPTTGGTLAAELADEPVDADGTPQRDVMAAGEGAEADGLPAQVEALTCRATPRELSRCSPQQLVQVHERLGGLMRRVMLELQARLCRADAET